MTACLCPMCRPSDPAITWTPEFRLEAEGRHVANLGDDADRYLLLVAKSRGQAAAEELRAVARDEWRRMRTMKAKEAA